jgi:two-component system LytT family response regulator
MKKVELSSAQISVAIIDDEIQCINSLLNYLKDDTRLTVEAKINDPLKAIDQIINKRPDLIFLDVEMPGMNGIEILKKLNLTNVKPFVIFITAFDKYTIEAIRASAFDYLLKPVDKNELAFVIERFIKKFNQLKSEDNYSTLIELTSKRKLRFNTTGGFIMIDPQDIIFIQADWNYSEIHFSKDKNEVVSINLGTIENLLPKRDFVRINRSVIINLKYLEKVQRGKRLCILKKDEESFSFKIPTLRIRFLEQKI